MTHKLHNRVLHRFSEEYYGKILREENLVEEIVIEETPLWYAVMNNVKYLISRDDVKKLPIKITETEEVHYKAKVFYYIKGYQTVTFKEEMNHTFRELTDELGNFEHSNPTQNLLYRLMCLASHLDRVNFRVATDAGFGKDSMWEILHILKKDVSVINPRSMPALEYRLKNKVLVLNELSNMESSQTDLIQEFLLLAGDMRTGYEKSTRAGSKTQDYYIIKNLSLCVMYNEYNYYAVIGKEKKYFDKVFTKAVQDRFIPFKFSGSLYGKQFVIDESEKIVAERHKMDYIKILRSIEYYRNNWRKHLKDWRLDSSNLGLSPRQEQNFMKIVQFVNLYSETKEEFSLLCQELINANKEYHLMLNEQNKSYKLNEIFDRETPKVRIY